MNILGISAFYHESACCLLQDGRLRAAAAEERFTRVKHDPRLPVNALRYCLQAGGLSIVDIDAVAYYEQPTRKLARQLWAGPPAAGQGDLGWLDPGQPLRALREGLGWEGEVLTVPHHRAHGASAFFPSGFEDAAVLTVDGVGEWDTTTYGQAQGTDIETFEHVRFPHSLGLLYATLTSYLGFGVNRGEYKVMGLAAYGRPRYIDEICTLIGMGADGQFRLNLPYFDFLRGQRMYSPRLCTLFGRPPRTPEGPIEPFHHDVARSLQLVLEEILLEKLHYLHRRTGARDLCMAGGVALNGVANGRIRREGPFARVFVQPAAGDAGACLGAAALAHAALTGTRPFPHPQQHTFYGPSYDEATVDALLRATGLDHARWSTEEDLVDHVAQRLADGQVVGWFHGAMEFGPRALGARSILANPLLPDIRDQINRRVKRRESFRPFAPSVLAEHASAHFDLAGPSPFMLETCQVTSPRSLPGITHVDGSARPQTVDPAVCPRYAALIEAFTRRTDCPMVLNTSFNMRGEPIVCTPVDALISAARAGLDALVLESRVIDRSALPGSWPTLLAHWQGATPSRFARAGAPLREQLYTFV